MRVIAARSDGQSAIAHSCLTDSPVRGFEDQAELALQRPVRADDPSMVGHHHLPAAHGKYLYWNLSTWNDYQVSLIRTDMTKV